MNRNNNFYIDVACVQSMHVGESICGDVFLSRKIKEEGRSIIVLSDGMGSGVKANILASLTASMGLSFTQDHRDVAASAQIIMDTLPICSERKISYSTFTIIDIDAEGNTVIVEYDNPNCLIMSGIKEVDPGWRYELLEDDRSNKRLRICSFKASMEYRIFFWTDGLVQAGMGSRTHPFGWGYQNLKQYAMNLIAATPFSSSAVLSRKLVNMAGAFDGGYPSDDTSAGIVYFREPRKLLLVTGPPFDSHNDLSYAMKAQQFSGKKIISGGTSAEIIARELALSFDQGMDIADPDLPPISYVEGFNLVTEGILTLGKVLRILEEYRADDRLGNGPAERIVKLFFESDRIHFLNGTGVNIAHQDPNLPVELEIRRSVVKRICRLLEDKFLKDVDIEYI
jgi:Stage II sporulation protein E (SpoIIE).